ncbi:MAG: MFS transporter [Alphaproteobacteria bacterium]|nr:MFS transporter [Alphaproteobacteria bacterium]
MASIADSAAPEIVARIDRLPPSRFLLGLILRIAVGNWFEAYELFMPGFISVGLIDGGVYTVTTQGLLDFHSFSSFLASFFAGMFLSTLVFGWVSDLLGRRAVFTYSMCAYSLFNLLIALSGSAAWIDLWRFLAGLAVGIQLINNDSYMSELTPRALRGRYMALAWTAVLSAVPVTAFLSMILVPHHPLGLAGWRWVVFIGSLGGIAVWFVQRSIPESPRWLATHGREREADEVVATIERQMGVSAERDLAPIAAASALPIQREGRWQEMFSGRYLPRTLIISVFQFCQTIGVFGFTSWVPILLARRGITVVHSLQYTFMVVLLTPIGGLLGTYLSERFERKWQLVGACLTIAGFGFGFALFDTVFLIVLSGAAVVLGNNWLISVFHSYAAELFPTRIRARALGFTFCWSRLSAVFVGYWVAEILAHYGVIGVFALIGGAMAVIVIVIGAFGPRTNGRSLEVLSP